MSNILQRQHPSDYIRLQYNLFRNNGDESRSHNLNMSSQNYLLNLHIIDLKGFAISNLDLLDIDFRA